MRTLSVQLTHEIRNVSQFLIRQSGIDIFSWSVSFLPRMRY